MNKPKKPTILIAPLDWGLGHATRCIPIIHHLIQLDCNIIIASEGVQQILLKKEFPELKFVSLPGYNITYTKYKRWFSLKIILQLPKIIKAVYREKKWLNKFVQNTPIDAIISDNRYGLYHTNTRSVLITHQLQIQAPFKITEKIIQFFHYRFINHFSACWVPDVSGNINIAGKLSHPQKMPATPVTYIGPLSRFSENTSAEKKYKLLIILSGPEPQRSLLEKVLMNQLNDIYQTVLFVRGLPGKKETKNAVGNLTIKNHLAAKELEAAFNESELIISRSGYTTVMDILKLQKKAILIPTPGQSEQEYLAQHLKRLRWAYTTTQRNFSLPHLLHKVKGFPYKIPDINMEGYKAVINDWVASLNS